MFVYRILVAKYAGKLSASGNSARWDSKDVKVIYTASSRSLACLENAVHRSQEGLLQSFTILTIECPPHIEIKNIDLANLAKDWHLPKNLHLTQAIGDKWIAENQTAILQVPSSIIHEETNYLLNPGHPDFSSIRIIKTTPFIFDGSIKQ